MDNIVLVLLAIVHLYFLYRVWTEVGMLWCLGCILLPPLALYIYYTDWSDFRGIFFTELVLVVVHVLVK